MALRYETTLTTSITDGGERELTVVVLFTVSPGSPGTGPGYYPPELYDEGSPDEVAIERVRLFDESMNEVEAPKWLFSMIEDDATLSNSLIEHYYERIAA